jgi:hypothetical protein
LTEREPAMPKDNRIVFENFNAEQERALIALLNLIIPTSEDGKMPSAANVDFFAYIHNENHFSWIRDGLLSICEESYNKYGREFSILSSSVQTQLVSKLRRRFFRFFSSLSSLVMQCYYQHDHVLEAIGIEVRPPFPQGYLVKEGDFTLLESVYERGKVYRD